MELNCKICDKIFKTQVLLENHLNNSANNRSVKVIIYFI